MATFDAPAVLMPPDEFWWAYLDQGVQYMLAARFEEAILNFDEALKYKPDDPRAHWNKAISLLSIGNYTQGFEELEWRWRLFDWCWGHLDKAIYRVEVLPPWKGESIAGKRLLMYHEQGFGDAIMMSRFIPKLQTLGADVVLMTVPSLKRLMASQFDIEVIDCVPDRFNGFDFRCSLFTPMRCLHYTVLSLPRQPYLKSTIAPRSGTAGIVWSGTTQRIHTSASFLESLERRDLALQALQFGDVPSDVAPLQVDDFFDTMQLMSSLQHIVTVDTAVAHLAGAMGHPSAHVLLPPLPDWRWYHGYAWYPTLHLHRDWDSLNRALWM